MPGQYRLPPRYPGDRAVPLIGSFTASRVFPRPERPEGRPDLGREQLGLFPGGEVAALMGLIEGGEAGVGLLDPGARGLEDLAGERGEADRDRDLRRRVAGLASVVSPALPVLPGRRGP